LATVRKGEDKTFDRTVVTYIRSKELYATIHEPYQDVELTPIIAEVCLIEQPKR